MLPWTVKKDLIFFTLRYHGHHGVGLQVIPATAESDSDGLKILQSFLGIQISPQNETIFRKTDFSHVTGGPGKFV